MIWYSHPFIVVPLVSLINRVRAHWIELTLLLGFNLHLSIRLEHFERLSDANPALNTSHELLVLRFQDLELVYESEVGCMEDVSLVLVVNSCLSNWH